MTDFALVDIPEGGKALCGSRTLRYVFAFSVVDVNEVLAPMHAEIVKIKSRRLMTEDGLRVNITTLQYSNRTPMLLQDGKYYSLEPRNMPESVSSLISLRYPHTPYIAAYWPDVKQPPSQQTISIATPIPTILRRLNAWCKEVNNKLTFLCMLSGKELVNAKHSWSTLDSAEEAYRLQWNPLRTAQYIIDNTKDMPVCKIKANEFAMSIGEVNRVRVRYLVDRR